jgi:hypothetical protein
VIPSNLGLAEDTTCNLPIEFRWGQLFQEGGPQFLPQEIGPLHVPPAIGALPEMRLDCGAFRVIRLVNVTLDPTTPRIARHPKSLSAKLASLLTSS